MTHGPETPNLTRKRITLFWLPLAATWFMMSAEGPFITALIARLDAAKYNLAAFGVAFSLALIVEAPIIMIMSASTALVKDAEAFRKLRRFTYALNALITAVMGILLAPPVFSFLAEKAIGLPPEVARITHLATLLLLPWPAAIGYRRFYQGILIRQNLTRRVAYGTVVRLCGMSVFGYACYRLLPLPGACIGAAALSFGVLLEAAASRWMARGPVREFRAEAAAVKPPYPASLRYREIASFYLPLALTSILTLAVTPIVTFFLGRSRFALESLAVLPVVHSFTFIFRCVGISYQEACVALLGDRFEGRTVLAGFGRIMGGCATGALAVVAFTPLSRLWFTSVSGLTPDLADFALLPLAILVLMPALEVLLSFQRALLIGQRRTRFVTWATGIEVGGLLVVLAFVLRGLDWPGVVGAATAILSGRLMAIYFLRGKLK